MGWAPVYRPDTDDLDAKLTLEQLRLVARNLAPNAVMMPLFAGVICFMFSGWVEPQRLLFWFVCVVIGVIPQGIAMRLYLRRTVEPARARFWLLLTVLTYFAFATCWSSMGLLLWVPHQAMDQLLIILLLGCTMAGSAAISGACRPVSTMSALLYGTMMTLLPLREGGPIYIGLSVLAFFYTAYMIYVGQSIHSTATDMLVLMHERTGLIDRLKRAKDDSDRARERAEQASQAKSQFLANMSHELRTPLNAILGFSEMIETFSTKPEKTKEYARFIHDSGSHLLALINDILDLAKIEAGGLALREGEVELAALIEESLKLIAPRAESAAVTLVSDISPGVPLLRADARALRQVLLNLLSNAVKFTPACGRVTAFAQIGEAGELLLGVHDTGVGIAADDLGKVFEKFGQGRHDVATTDKGTGLGLAIVKGLIEAHGGTIRLESEVGLGTTVTATLPAERLLGQQAQKVA